MATTEPFTDPPPAVDALDSGTAGTLPQLRRRAVAEAVAEARAPDNDPSQPVLAVRGYGHGCMALALGGTFDTAFLDRLEGTLRDVRRTATTELVVDLGALAETPRRLARILGHLRMTCLTSGARVELHNVPAGLRDDLDVEFGGPAPVSSFSVRTEDRGPRRG